MEPGMLVCALVTQFNLAEKMLLHACAIKSRGTHVIIVSQEVLRERCADIADFL